MHDIAVAAANLVAQHEHVLQQPAADPSQVAQFQQLMNAGGPEQGAADRYVPAIESPLETLSSQVTHVGGRIANSFRTEMTQFDGQMSSIDVTSPGAMLAVTQMQIHAFGVLYQVNLATGLAGQVDRGFQTLLHVQS